LTVRRLGHAKHFQSGMLTKKVTWSYFNGCSVLSKGVLQAKICAKFRCGHFTLKVLVLGCRALDFTHANGFQVFCTHGMPKTWADAGPLNVKYLVNAVYFIRKLRGNGLIFLKFCRVPSDP